MPDLDFDGFRNNLHNSVRQPPVDDVIKRAQQRSSRRRLQIVSAAAVVLAVAAVPLLRLGVQRDAAPPLNPSDQNFVVSMDFYDLTHGFALGSSCEHRPICDAWVMATGDGSTWETRSTPPIETGYSSQPDRLVALGSSTLIIDDYRPDNIVKRFFSSDGARTWQEVPIQSVVTHTRFASSTILECRGGKVTAVTPGNGHSAELANQPPFDVKSCQSYPDLNKRWWVAGLDRATRKPMVAWSKDGEQWTSSELPAFTSPDKYPAISIIASLTAVYATVTNPGDTPADLVAIFRSTDAGVTWEQTWQASDGRQPTSISGVPVAGTDGKLRISQYPRAANEVWTSADGGRTFTAEQRDAPGDVRWIRTGYLATHSSTGEYMSSYDGFHWKPMKLPFP